ncbi:GNAT family N-acetyltransferase [Micromonospora sp. WMMD1082]|uniref:GNAT family N-acetyltransferase n=1 Tax=Micromonospora sp. WMMD1082 TaxID=3016104 RepID=UPI0024170ADD|nr:GNAT family N-acetyltransferase [Micromonospora sp. WMMD1082]MDG4798244.1 GNAT family N-acetyltransferase [Micromonospora sp. WMMD1082]
MDAELRIETAGPAMAAAAAGVLCRSHAEYPAFQHLFPDRARRLRVLRPFLTATARDAARHGRLDVARIGDRVGGAALWMPPGAWPATPGRKLRMTPALTVALLTAGGRARPWLRTGAAIEADTIDGWYLIALGVDPSAQRRGVGGHLLSPVLALADVDGATVGLHTSDPANVAYYQRFGFTVTRPLGELFPGGPAYLSMRRPPQPS